ncbi:hypothetical protein A2631_01350 [Candidatus Daviesbacteria bacterium RIFCSPHIGHO2_01_FULL_44_29]|uniref:Uncharacterized protein n=1 Tax=Candidatus Daviesbacteria bacterium RIFCSPHIGHO2_02_FULL_43_12 TaxID=1797776 RepID=A0A1F5KKT0_9BACT|nr:MAG: hypothetical protein A2631_01350 [Candidatus Daviesbacteria bacterium RIFCSPHIGHO2_01_FULL_44_29]OGE39678.1 MAG: hypothetical protein A3E86_00050 [Candidatus Daviesbacteria bacterium RIFCSPHIGHO2_12_FULL_47_45]OGE41537.1 MAG: hypothetical protein A3D25_00770 [Candidatus Daviesbacteria bacterium RIFCSPHIGHO2_02_FULL_43_12]OGE69819.1 MAG: hypothetical protein A3B55_05415 [Candidatus Daviesbacteria bacterium RIFCSPLOWO2_01_FULL_43_15]
MSRIMQEVMGQHKEPQGSFAIPTHALQKRHSTSELLRHRVYFKGKERKKLLVRLSGYYPKNYF